MTVRMTDHNSRFNRNGVHSATHIGRDFDVTKAENIDETLMREDVFIIYEDNVPVIPKFHIDNHIVIFDDHCGLKEHELNCYQQYIGAALEKRNERKRNQRHVKDCKTIDDIYIAKNTCPEEQLFYLGKSSEHAPPDILLKAFQSYQEELTKKYGDHIKFLTAALHVDEKGAPHIHFRRIYVDNTEDGLYISQTKALQQMGFERPHPENKETKWNNVKISFTKFERHLKFEIARALGVELEEKPERPGKRTQELFEHLAEVAEERQHIAEEKQKAATDQLKIIQERITSTAAELEEIRTDAELAEAQNQQVKESLIAMERELDAKATLPKETIKKLTKPSIFAKKTSEGVPQLFDYECTQVRAYISRCFNLETERKKLEKEKAELESIIEQRVKERLPEEYRCAKEDAEIVREWIGYAKELEARELRVSEREQKIETEVNQRVEFKINEMMQQLNTIFILKPLELLKRIIRKIMPSSLWAKAEIAAEDELKKAMNKTIRNEMETDDVHEL